VSGSGGVEERAALVLDASARRAALDVGRSVLLQAPAGSGKTTVLTARVLALLAHAEEPEEILAITFTRKAAAQMRARILAALEAASAGERIEGIDPEVLAAAWQRDCDRGWQLLRNPGRVRVQTIDALNHWLAGQLPIAARSGPALQITATPQPLYRRAARRALREVLEDETMAGSAALLFERLDNRWTRLEDLLSEMLERRTHWLPRVLQPHEGALLARVRESLHSVLRGALAAALASVPATLWREGEAILGQCELPELAGTTGTALNADPESLPRWRALCRIALTGEGWRRQLTKREGFERTATALKERARCWIGTLSEHPGTEATLRAVQELPDAQLGSSDSAALEALAALLTGAAAELQLEFVASGKVDYAYVAAAARQALHEQGEPSDLALRFGAALRHVLVDEFQDTSLEQFGLLRVLTAGWEHADGRTLFLVGDPMQSIYQFREAEVGLFLQAREYGVGPVALQPLELRRNFRSRAPLVAWINEHCEQLFPAHDDPRLAAIRYLRSIPGRLPADGPAPEDAAPAVRVHALPSGDPAAEAQRVVQIVRAARARDAAASIAILVASRDHAASIVPALREAGFALRGVDLERLRDRPVVRDLLALTRALLHGADRTAWLALLRAPWCGVPLGVLETLLGEANGDLYTSLEAALRDGPGATAPTGAHRARLMRLCAALAPALRGPERALPLWRRALHCWLRLGGPAAYPCERDRLDARRFIDALAQHDGAQALVGEAMEEITERLFSSAPPEPGAIEIMTIHAAKGLEWDVVILPGLARRTAPDRDPLLHWIELPRPRSGTDLLLAPIRAQEEPSGHTLAHFIRGLRRERAKLERVRLLYVAMTRARHSLHLLGAAPFRAGPAGAPALAMPAPGSLLWHLWPALEREFLAAMEPPPGARGEPSGAQLPVQDAAAPQLWRLPADWTLPALPRPPAAQRVELAAPATRELPEYHWVGLTARAVGTIVHAELQRLAAEGGEIAQRAAPGRRADYAAWLGELGVPAGERAAAAQRVLSALEATLGDPRGRWLLSDAHREARSEWRLTGLHGGRVVNVVIDRMLVDEHGERWIVDFKTSTHEGGALGAFIATEVQRYRGQLERYAALASQLDGGTVRLALYFPLLGVFRELER
jgi:ATP-dependent exoDNAse (exonuclease V) beta subunit